MKSTVAKCAAAIRAELKVAFPGTKFTVRSESFAGGNAVDIRYLDGPKREDVCSITDKYQYGSFDGMTDSYNVDNKKENLPQAKFVQVERRATEETKKAIAQEFGISDDQLNDWNDRFQCYNSEYIYRVFVQRDYSDKTEDHADVMGSFNEDGDTVFPSYDVIPAENLTDETNTEPVIVTVEGVVYTAVPEPLQDDDFIYGVKSRWNLFSDQPDPRTKTGQTAYLAEWHEGGTFAFWQVGTPTRSLLSPSSVVFGTPGPDPTPGPGQGSGTTLPCEGDGIPGASMVFIKEGADVDLVTRLFDNSGTGNAVLLTSAGDNKTGRAFFEAVEAIVKGEPDQVFPSYILPNKNVPMFPGTNQFKNEDTDREKLLTGKWVDTSVQYPNQVTFDKVYAQYRGGQILRVAEVYANGDWRPTSDFFTEIEFEIWQPAEMIQRLVDTQGAEIFCLEIEDEFGRIKNPDFRTNELFPG